MDERRPMRRIDEIVAEERRMNDQPIVSLDEERARYLVQFEALARELATPLPVDRAAEIERKLSMLEDIARRSGLFGLRRRWSSG